MADKRLIIDLAQCDRCEECGVDCGGVPTLREQATFELVCRRCALASCVAACPFDALERLADGGVIRRHNLRCVSCKLCAHACPFGTIYPEMLGFYQAPCHGCRPDEGQAPPCVAGCARGALEYRALEPNEPGVYVIDGFLAARAERWVRRELTGEAAP